MNRIRASVIGVGVAFLVAACSGAETPSSPGASGGSKSANTGGSTTGPLGGSSGTIATGGSTTGPLGGSTGGPTGGTGTISTGGASGASGATTSTGGANGTTGGAGVGGSTATGGSAGSAAGGAAVGGSTGGAPPAGGTGAGGTAGGSTGGAAPAEPQLVTSAPNAYWKTDGTLTEAASGNADVTVNDTSTAQTWEGFGGAFNEKGWNYLSQLSQADRDLAMKLLFGVDGAHFAFGRIPIGASDYAMDRYSLDDTANDTTMAKFSIARDKEKLIPYVKAALAVKPDIHLWASPWSPPPWMKSNGAFDRGNMKEDATTFQALALYLAKFVTEYGKEGIKIDVIAPQNEPGYEQDYPSCLWTGGGMAKFIGMYLGPTFESQSVPAQIFLGTMSNPTDSNIVTAVTGDATAMKYVKGFGLQWGMMSGVGGLKSRNLPIWQTEHKCGNYPWGDADYPSFNSSKAPNDQAYGVESWKYITQWIKAGVTSYSAWNMVLDQVGLGIDTKRVWPQNALLVVDTGSKKLIQTPAFHVFRHLSQFVDPGAKVVGTSGGDALAFKNPDGTIVAVMFNSGGAKTSIISIGGKKLQFAMPGNGWATVNWK